MIYDITKCKIQKSGYGNQLFLKTEIFKKKLLLHYKGYPILLTSQIFADCLRCFRAPLIQTDFAQVCGRNI